jgi:parallel beta-helix repeat protein
MSTYTTNQFLYKPSLGASGTVEKEIFDTAFDLVDARLGKQVWVSDPVIKSGTTLADAISYCNGRGTEITLRIPPGSHTISSDTTINQKVSLMLERNANIIINNGITVNIAGPFIAGRYKTFVDNSGDDTKGVKFSQGAVQYIFPEWWGARAASGMLADAVGNSFAIQKAINSQSDYCAPHIVFGLGEYLIDSTITVKAGTTLEGQGGSQYAFKSTKIVAKTGFSGHIITVPSMAYDVKIRDLDLDGQVYATNGIDASAGSAQFLRVQNCTIWRCTNFGIYHTGNGAGLIAGNHIFGCPNGIRATMDSKYINNEISGGSSIVKNHFFSDTSYWLNNGNWTITGGKAVHSVGSSNTLEQAVSPVIGRTYGVSFIISDRTAGSVTVSLGGVSGTTRSANGTWWQELTPTTTGNLIITPTSDFDGKIDNVYAEWGWGIYLPSDGSLVEGNIVYGDGGLRGALYLATGDRNAIVGNRFDTSGVGIYIYNTGGMINNNLILGNRGHGIYSDYYPGDFDISHNIIKGNNGYGIYFYAANGGQITRNTLLDNILGGIRVPGNTTLGTYPIIEGNIGVDIENIKTNEGRTFAFPVLADNTAPSVQMSKIWTTDNSTRSYVNFTQAPRGKECTIIFGLNKTVTFVRSLGSELVVNGAFTADTDWTKGTGWTIGSGVASHTTGTASVIEQNVTAVANKLYEVTFTVTSIASGNLLPKIGGTNGYAVKAIGTYTQLIGPAASTANLQLCASSDFVGSIDNISCKEINTALKGHGGTDWTGITAGDHMRCVKGNDGYWYCECFDNTP